jgi:G3E family GTPase
VSEVRDSASLDYKVTNQSDTRHRQVACADVILLNKTDLVTKSVLHQVESTIRFVSLPVLPI